MAENSIIWILGVVAVGFIFIIVGYFASKNLPTKERKLRSQKFVLAALAFIFFCLPIFKPYVSSNSRTYSFREQKAENLVSVEDLAKYEKDQTRNIELLKEEVERLREELNEMNDYYGFMLQLLSFGIASLCIGFIFRKKDDNLEEIESNKLEKL